MTDFVEAERFELPNPKDQIYSLAVLTTHPKTHIKRLTQVMTIIEMLQATPRVLYTLMVYGDNLPTPPNILFAKGHYRFALLVGRVGIEPTHHF